MYGIFSIRMIILQEKDLPLEKKIENINLNISLLNEKILFCLQNIINVLKNLKTFYDKTIMDVDHWIYTSLEEMIENDENSDQNDIKILKFPLLMNVF